MEVTKDNINRFGDAVFNFIGGIKEGTDACCASFSDLNEREFHIINFIGRVKSAKMSEISDGLGAPLSTLTSIVDKLVEKKYLARYHSNEDRRVVLVVLATNGTVMFNTLQAKKEEMATKVLQNYTAEEQQTLIKFMEDMPKHLRT